MGSKLRSIWNLLKPFIFYSKLTNEEMREMGRNEIKARIRIHEIELTGIAGIVILAFYKLFTELAEQTPEKQLATLYVLGIALFIIMMGTFAIIYGDAIISLAKYIDYLDKIEKEKNDD